MPRPSFPASCILPVSAITRITQQQANYDKDPERAEIEQAARAKCEELERIREREYEEEVYKVWLQEQEEAIR